jgi:hypothetical protein
VLATEKERAALAAHLAARAAGDVDELDLPVRRAREVSLVAAGAEVHVDDELEQPSDEPSAMGGSIKLTLLPGALQFLL